MTHPVIYLLFQTQVSLFVPARKDAQSIPFLPKPAAPMQKTTISLCSFLWSAFSSCLICLVFFIDTSIPPIAVPSLLVVEALLHCLQLLLAIWSSGPFMAVPYLCWCKLYSTNSKLVCFLLYCEDVCSGCLVGCWVVCSMGVWVPLLHMTFHGSYCHFL